MVIEEKNKESKPTPTPSKEEIDKLRELLGPDYLIKGETWGLPPNSKMKKPAKKN